MCMKINCLFCKCLGLLLLFSAFCTTSYSQVLPNKLSSLPPKVSDRIVIAGNLDWPPLQYVDADGKLQGYITDLISSLFNEMSVPYTYKLSSSLQLFDKVPDDVDLTLSLHHSVGDIDEYMNFALPIYRIHPILLIRREDAHFTVDDLSRMHILILNDGFSEAYIHSMGFNPEITKVNDVDELLYLLQNGPFQALCVGKEVAQYLIRKEGKEKQFRFLEFNFPTMPIYLCTTRDNPRLVVALKKAWDILEQRGDIDQLQHKWFMASSGTWATTERLLLIAIFLLVVYYGAIFYYWRRYQIQKDLDQKNLDEFVKQVGFGMPFYYTLEDITNARFLGGVGSLVHSNNFSEVMIGERGFYEFSKSLSADTYTLILEKRVEAIRTRGVVVVDMPYTYPDGQHVMINMNLKVFDSHDKTYMLTVAYELDEWKEIKERAERAVNDKKLFVEHMSHEIRTPLNSIIGFSDLLHLEKDIEVRNEFKNLILQKNEEIDGLVNDLITLSELDAGQIKIVLNSNDAMQLFFSVEGLLPTNHQASKVRLVTEKFFQVCLFQSDGRLYNIVAQNFLSNALKHTNEGVITLGVAYDEGSVIFYVEDTGCGISRNKLPYIFERFTKGDMFAQGTGIGLAICQSIAMKARGSIGVYSKENKGSLFWISFPAEDAICVKIDDIGHAYRVEQLNKRWEGVWYETEDDGRMSYNTPSGIKL